MEDNNHFPFSITTMPASRPAHYYLGYLDGCVFMDFNRTPEGFIQLIRISFDGYGCCSIQNAVPIEPDHVTAFKAMMKAGILDQPLLTIIVRKTIADNKDRLWQDALIEYDLL